MYSLLQGLPSGKGNMDMLCARLLRDLHLNGGPMQLQVRHFTEAQGFLSSRAPFQTAIQGVLTHSNRHTACRTTEKQCLIHIPGRLLLAHLLDHN